MKRGILLVNLGTPDSPHPKSVGKYLKEFLMDPYIIDIPAFFRWLTVHLLIVPRRKKASSLLYKKVWGAEGSPLLFYTLDLARKLQDTLGEGDYVVPAMRYGNPSIEEALQKMKGKVSRVLAVPLYPQYSLAATESSIQKIKEIHQKYLKEIPLDFIPAFYKESWYLEPLKKQIQENFYSSKWDALVFSYHGLPERQIKKNDECLQHCFKTPDCCEKSTQQNKNCYRHQCFETTKFLVKELGLPTGKYFTAFQSRLGRTPWIKPYTDHLYSELPKRGFKRIAVVSPSFVADCLETLEEIQIRGRELFIKEGGEELKLIPCLNTYPDWVGAFSNFLARSER